MNAVLLKELRQSVRNRYVLAAYVIFVVVLLIVAGVQTSQFVRTSWSNPQSIFDAGKTLFQTIHAIFAALSFLFIPTYVLSRITREHWGTDLDLMYVTPMPPASLLIGKFGSAMALAGLFLSAALPFLVLSYFIGGMDVLSIVMTVILTLEIAAALTLYAMAVAIAPMPKIIRNLTQIGLVMQLLIAVYAWVFVSTQLCNWGYMSILRDSGARLVLLELMALGVSVAGLSYAAALAGFRPATVDRMRPFRTLATALIAGWGGVLACQSRIKGFEYVLEIWAAVLMVFSAGMLVVGLSERTEYGMHIRKRLPRSRVGRVLGYPFRTGQLNAVCWALLLLAAGITFSRITSLNAMDWRPFHVVVLNISGYALTLLVLWRYVLRFEGMPAASLWWVTGTVIVLITAILGPLCIGGVDAINYFPGYLFAHQREVLPRLYRWNAFALLALLPAYLGLPKRTST